MEQVSNSATIFNELASRSWNNGNFTPVLPFEFTDALFEKLSVQVKEHGYLVEEALISDLPTLKEKIGKITGKEVEEIEDIVCLLEAAFLAAQEALKRFQEAERLVYEEKNGGERGMQWRRQMEAQMMQGALARDAAPQAE